MLCSSLLFAKVQIVLMQFDRLTCILGGFNLGVSASITFPEFYKLYDFLLVTFCMDGWIMLSDPMSGILLKRQTADITTNLYCPQ